MRKVYFLLFSLTILFIPRKLKAQKVKFTPDPIQLVLNEPTKVYEITFQVEDLDYGDSAIVNFNQPISNNLKLNEHYRIAGPVKQTIYGRNNESKYSIKLYNLGLNKTEALYLEGTAKKGKKAPTPFHVTIIINYIPEKNIPPVTPSSVKPSSISSTVLPLLVNDVDSIETEYNCRETSEKPAQLVQEKTFKESLKPIFSKVILNNDGLVKNGTAVNLAVNNGINLSASYQKSYSDKSFYKMGFNTIVKDKIGDIFSNKRFKNEFSFSFGISQVIGNPGRFFLEKPCEELKEERTLFEEQLKNLFNNYSFSDTARLKDTLKRYEALTKIIPGTVDPNFSKYVGIRGKVKDTLTKIIKLYKTIRENGSESIVRDSLSKWELKKAINWSGYQVTWMDYDFTLPFNGYYVHDVLKGKDSATYKLMGAFRARTTFNRVHYGRKLLLYIYGGVQGLIDRGILAIPSTDTINIKNGEKTNSYLKVTNNDWYKLYIFGLSPSINSMIFWGEDKVFGLELGLSCKHFFYDKMPTDKNNIWNARAGILFSLKGENEISTGTLGIFAQLVDYKKADGKVGDNIGIGVRVGLPFERTFKL